jgi:hypothetical protein
MPASYARIVGFRQRTIWRVADLSSPDKTDRQDTNEGPCSARALRCEGTRRGQVVRSSGAARDQRIQSCHMCDKTARKFAGCAVILSKRLGSSLRLTLVLGRPTKEVTALHRLTKAVIAVVTTAYT